MIRILLTSCLAVLAAEPAGAAESAIPATPFPLHPAAAPSPALKYTLLPELRDQVPGNAVPHYREAIRLMKQDGVPSREWYPQLDEWMQKPLKDFPRDEARKFLDSFQTAFKELDLAARSEQCDWELTEKLRKSGIAVLLPDVQECRSMAALLQLKIRLETAEGHYDKAIRSLQTGYALSRHVADAPTLISALVGMAIGNIMTARLEEVLQQPDAPNLYWALTDLPHPFIDMRKPMQGERLSAYGTFPGMADVAADPNAGPLRPEQIEQIVSVLQNINEENNELLKLKNKMNLGLRLLARHEADKQILIDQGRPKDKVDSWPHLQVGLLVALQEYDEIFDEALKATSLPDWQRRPALGRMEKLVKEAKAKKDGPAVPLAALFLPALTKVMNANVRTERRLAVLRCVEAIRLYAATHDGKLPSALSEIKEVPIPLDPLTGKDFEYTAVGDRATLSGPTFPGEAPMKYNTVSLELLLKR